MADVVAILKAEEKALEKRLYALQSAIEALEGGDKKEPSRGKRTMSAATKRKLSLAAKARWAKVKKTSKVHL
jgi:hypothetical protein